MRLDKFLAHNGLGSRKDVKKLIKQKQVRVNGQTVQDPGILIDTHEDQVQYGDQILHFKEHVYYMLNKPQGYICSHDFGMYPSALELIDDPRPDLIFVGRLDVDTEGLLLITNDGQFSHQIAHGKKEVYKKYYVELQKDFQKEYLSKLEEGMILDDEKLKPAKVDLIDSKSLYLSIAEGKYHQVKRMMHQCDNEVTYLKRVQIGSLTLDEKLSLGEYRELSDDEISLFIPKS